MGVQITPKIMGVTLRSVIAVRDSVIPSLRVRLFGVPPHGSIAPLCSATASPAPTILNAVRGK